MMVTFIALPYSFTIMFPTALTNNALLDAIVVLTFSDKQVNDAFICDYS